MLSAEPYPVVLADPLRLPPILPQNATLYAWLRQLQRRTLAWPRAPRRRVREHGVIRSELAEATVTGLSAIL
jgi:hypothetical protein